VREFDSVCTGLKFFSIVRVNETSVLWTVLTQRDKRNCQVKVLLDNFLSNELRAHFSKDHFEGLWTRVTVNLFIDSLIRRSSCAEFSALRAQNLN